MLLRWYLCGAGSTKQKTRRGAVYGLLPAECCRPLSPRAGAARARRGWSCPPLPLPFNITRGLATLSFDVKRD